MLTLVKLFSVDHGKMSKGSWKIMEKSWNLIPENRWEPCDGPSLYCTSLQ